MDLKKERIKELGSSGYPECWKLIQQKLAWIYAHQSEQSKVTTNRWQVRQADFEFKNWHEKRGNVHELTTTHSCQPNTCATHLISDPVDMTKTISWTVECNGLQMWAEAIRHFLSYEKHGCDIKSWNIKTPFPSHSRSKTKKLVTFAYSDPQHFLLYQTESEMEALMNKPKFES